MDVFVPVAWIEEQLESDPLHLVVFTAYAFGLGVLFHWKLWPKLVGWIRRTLGTDRLDNVMTKEDVDMIVDDSRPQPMTPEQIREAVSKAKRD